MDFPELEPRRKLRLKPILLSGALVLTLLLWAHTVSIIEEEPIQAPIEVPTINVQLQPPVAQEEVAQEAQLEDLVDAVDEALSAIESSPTGPVPASLDAEPAGQKTVAFMGIRESTQRVVIAFDVAESVRRKAESAGLPLERIRDEASSLVQSLDERSAFVMLQFVRRYQQFPAEMLPASTALRDEAVDWLRMSFRTDGRSGGNWTGGEPDGIELVLSAALELQPEVLFLISDGDFQRTRGNTRRGWENVSWRTLEEQVAQWQLHNGRRVRIHFIGIQMESEHLKEARRFVARFGGQLRLIN